MLLFRQIYNMQYKGYMELEMALFGVAAECEKDYFVAGSSTEWRSRWNRNASAGKLCARSAFSAENKIYAAVETLGKFDYVIQGGLPLALFPVEIIAFGNFARAVDVNGLAPEIFGKKNYLLGKGRAFFKMQILVAFAP